MRFPGANSPPPGGRQSARSGVVTIPMAIAVYFTMWWTVLFAVLPFGVRSAQESGAEVPKGTDRGAPVAPMLLRKAVATTIIAAILLAALQAYMVWMG
jgi:predicted secreted protein